MHRKVLLGVLGCAIALSACDGGGSSGEGSTTDASSSSTDDVQTTIPVTSVSDSNTDPTTASSTSTGTSTGGETETTSDTDADTDTDTSSSSETSGSTAGSSSSSGGDDTTTGEPTVWDVGWCNLQFPPSIAAGTADTTAVYSRIYVEGLTDQTPGNDIDANLVVEFGYGADGSDPAEAEWTWVAGEGNVGWDGSMQGEPNNDEYQGGLQFAEVGSFDYAARVSGDGGATWVYCDLDGLVEGGYSPDQAGDAVIE